MTRVFYNEVTTTAEIGYFTRGWSTRGGSVKGIKDYATGYGGNPLKIVYTKKDSKAVRKLYDAMQNRNAWVSGDAKVRGILKPRTTGIN